MIHHQLVMFLHGKTDGKDYASTRNASTLATERFIGQSQSKTTELQSLCQEPSVAETLDRAGQIQYNLSVFQELSSKDVRIKPTNNRRKTAYLFNKHKSNTTYQYPASYEEFKSQMCGSFFEGIKDAQAEMAKLPSEFRDTLGEFWAVPFTFQHIKHEIIDGAPHDDYNHLRFKRQPGEEIRSTEDSFENQDNESDQEETVTGAQLDTNDCDLLSDSNDEQESVPSEKSSVNIVRGNSTINLSRALTLAMKAKDSVNKDRAKRHIVYLMKTFKEIPSFHDVVAFRYYVIKNKSISIVQIVCIETELGTQVQSTTRSGKDKFRGILMDYDPNSLTVTRPMSTRVSSLRSVRQIVREVRLVSLEDGSMSIDNDSVCALKELTTRKESPHAEPLDLPEGFYEIQDIVDRRIDQATYTHEYLVKFKDFEEEEMQWLPEGAFLHNVPFTSTSRFGRVRKHTTSYFPGKGY